MSLIQEKEAKRQKERDIREALTKGTQAYKEVQQPLNPKTGYSNPEFDRFYGAKQNPHTGTERDWRNRGRKKIFV